MALTTETFTVPLGGWTRGLNRDVFELQLEAEETPDALNVDLGLRGEFDVRDGYDEISNASAGLLPTVRLFEFTPLSGSDILVAVDENGQVYQSALAGADPYFTMAAQTADWNANGNKRTFNIDAAMLDDQLYLFSLRGNTWRWNGTSWTEITDTTLDETGTAAAPTAPQAATATTHKNRVWAGNIVANGANSRSRVAWSMTPVENSGDAGGNRWKAAAFIDVNEDDGTEIRKIVSFQSNLMIFKDFSLHLLAGYDEDSFTLYPVDADVGTTAPNTVAFNESDMFWFDPRKGVYVFDGSKTTRIDTAIHHYLMDGLRNATAHESCGFLKDGKYYLSVPWAGDGSHPTRTFIFDTRLGAWMEYDYGFFSIVDFGGETWMGGPMDLAGIYDWQQNTTTDAGVGIAWHLETIWFPPADKQGMTKHRMRRCDLWVEADSGTMTVDMWVDGTESAVWTQSVTASTNRVLLPAYNGLWEICKFKFSGTTS